MVRLADSDLFRKLPAANIRILLEHIEKISVSEGEVIVSEGDAGDYYYVIEAGHALVTRRTGQDAPSVLAELAVGDAFGEEEMVAGPSRNASVTMLTDGELLRLAKHQFIDVVRDALVDKVPYAIARRMNTEGAIWLDVRGKHEFSSGAFPGAINVPLNELRESAKNLLAEQSYLVCGENAGAASVGTLLLAQRGFDAVCITEPVSAALGNGQDSFMESDSDSQHREESDDATVVAFSRAEEPRDDPVAKAISVEQSLGVEDVESIEPIPRDLYDDTYVGQTLADLIDQMHSRHQQLLRSDESAETTATEPVEVIDLETFQAEVEDSLPNPLDGAPALSLASEEVPATTETLEPVALLDPSANSDNIAELMRAIETQIRNQVGRSIEEQRARVRAELAERIQSVKQAAVREVRKQVEAYRDRYRAEHATREQKLKTQYDKLMGLAHRISRQKAELQRARKDLQRKLDATARLQAEIDGLRTNLSGRLDSFDDIEDDGAGL